MDIISAHFVTYQVSSDFPFTAKHILNILLIKKKIKIKTNLVGSSDMKI